MMLEIKGLNEINATFPLLLQFMRLFPSVFVLFFFSKKGNPLLSVFTDTHI